MLGDKRPVIESGRPRHPSPARCTVAAHDGHRVNGAAPVVTQGPGNQRVRPVDHPFHLMHSLWIPLWTQRGDIGRRPT